MKDIEDVVVDGHMEIVKNSIKGLCARNIEVFHGHIEPFLRLTIIKFDPGVPIVSTGLAADVIMPDIIVALIQYYRLRKDGDLHSEQCDHLFTESVSYIGWCILIPYRPIQISVRAVSSRLHGIIDISKIDDFQEV